MSRPISMMRYCLSADRRRFACILFIFAIPYVIVFATGFFILYRGLTELSLEKQDALSFPTVFGIHEVLHRIEDLGTALSIHPTIRDAIVDEDWERAEEVMQIFHQLLEHSNEDFILDIFLTDIYGISRAGTADDKSTIGEDFSHREWYQGLQNSGQPYLSGVYERATEPFYRVVTLAVPVHTDSGELSAILVLQLQVGAFLEWSNEIKVGDGGFIYIVDQNGTIIAHPEIDTRMTNLSNEPFVQRALSGTRGIEVVNTAAGPQVVAYEHIPQYNWTLFVQQSAERVFAERNRLLIMVLALAIAILIVYLFFFTWLIRRTDPRIANLGLKFISREP